MRTITLTVIWHGQDEALCIQCLAAADAQEMFSFPLCLSPDCGPNVSHSHYSKKGDYWQQGTERHRLGREQEERQGAL